MTGVAQPMPLSETQIERYARHILLPEVGGVGQERLLAATVRVVGSERSAEECAIYLAAAGIGRLALDRALTGRIGSRLAALNPDVLAVDPSRADPDRVVDLTGRDQRLEGARAALAAVVALSTDGGRA